MYATAALLVLLASTQVVFANFTSVHFSAVNQCGPFSVNFTGGQLPTALPLTLTIVPFYARPVSIPIPLTGWDQETQSGSAVVDFLPLYEGTQFLASLDDADGNSLGLVSDVLKSVRPMIRFVFLHGPPMAVTRTAHPHPPHPPLLRPQTFTT